MLGLFAVMTACLFTYKYLDFIATGRSVSPLVPLIEEGGGTVTALVLFPLFYWVAVHFPLSSQTWCKNLPVHLVTVCLLSFLETSAMDVERHVLFPLAGLGAYDYGYMPVRYVMEFSDFFLVYWAGVAIVYSFHHIRFAREQEIRQAKLEAGLAAAQLQNLRLQLEPHFLFNVLNTISTEIYEDPRTADEMIGRLSTLLRHLLEKDCPQEITLQREMELLNLYTRMMQARFEERLKITTHIDHSLHHVLVPQLILQPLVENAIRHGGDRSTFEIRILIDIKQAGNRLSVSIRDHGPGFSDFTMGGGIGLRNTAERLQRLYGKEQSFNIRNADEGGAIVELKIPFSRAKQEERRAPTERIWA